MVPNGWEVRNLENLASVERGKFSARPRNDPKYYGGEIPFVQTGDIAGAKTYLKSYSQTLNEEGLKVSRLFPKDTILITIAANIGDVAITSFDVACPDSLVAIQPKEGTNVIWLYFYLETCQKELDGQATQNAQKNINLQVLRPLEVLTPPLPEQQKIAKILSTWDKAITTTERLIENSAQQKKALMQQLLTGKKRLFDESGKRFEGEWDEVTIDSTFKLITDYVASGSFASLKENVNVSDDEGYAHYVRQTDLAAKFKNKTLKWVNEDSYNYLKKSNLYEGDILFTNIGDLGKVFYMPKLEKPATVAPNLIVLRVNQKNNSKYIFYMLSSYVGQRQINRIKSGTGLPKINKTEFKTMRFKIPRLEEQQKIATVLTNADKEIELLEQQLADLQQEKKALMQVLLTGKKRVVVE